MLNTARLRISTLLNKPPYSARGRGTDSKMVAPTLTTISNPMTRLTTGLKWELCGEPSRRS
jgi:hypothetical protein